MSKKVYIARRYSMDAPPRELTKDSELAFSCRSALSAHAERDAEAPFARVNFSTSLNALSWSATRGELRELRNLIDDILSDWQ